MRKTRLHWWPCGAAACFIGLAVCCPAGVRADVADYTVQSDTYIDSTHTTTNYGGSASLKVFVDSPSPTPTHALIGVSDAINATSGMTLGQELGSIPAGDQVDVKLWVYNYGGTSLTQNIEVHPLTAGFTAGNGTAASGATWTTYDGTNPWATPGGDYAADCVSIPPPSVQGYQWYSVDITSLLQGSDRSDLLSDGLLLKVYNDAVSPGNTTGQNFESSRNTNQPYFQVTITPEPATVALLAAGAGVAAIGLARRRRASRR